VVRIDYLVMEFLAGETVREQLDRDFLSTQDVVRYGTHIAEALAGDVLERRRRGLGAKSNILARRLP
jgi:hypothetical protein